MTELQGPFHYTCSSFRLINWFLFKIESRNRIGSSNHLSKVILFRNYLLLFHISGVFTIPFQENKNYFLAGMHQRGRREHPLSLWGHPPCFPLPCPHLLWITAFTFSFAFYANLGAGLPGITSWQTHQLISQNSPPVPPCFSSLCFDSFVLLRTVLHSILYLSRSN